LNKYSIILLQECYDDTFSSLEQNFPEYYIFRDTVLGINIICNGLVILSKYPITSYKSIHFKNYNSWTYDSLINKGFIVANINIDGTDICLINTHLQSADYERYDKIVILQMKEIFNYINARPNMKYIIGGDFNIDIKDINKIYTNNNIKYYYPINPTIYVNFNAGTTQSYGDKSHKGLVFDYLITNKNSNITIKDIKCIHCNYSDHNPVSGIIELTKASLEGSLLKNTLIDSSDGRNEP
jgi:endonuclease/exonuclease/phosphatase family metal-dependent hydrolase